MPSSTTVYIPVICRVCGCPKLVQYPAAVVAAALTGNRPLRIHSCCRATSWSASEVELQRIREHLGGSLPTSRVDPQDRTPADAAGVRDTAAGRARA